MLVRGVLRSALLVTTEKYANLAQTNVRTEQEMKDIIDRPLSSTLVSESSPGVCFNSCDMTTTKKKKIWTPERLQKC